MVRKILKVFGYLLLSLLVIELVIYFLAPVYDFPQPTVFSGEKLYNPYEGMDSTQWRKANFHFHTKAWGGLTSGRHNTHDAFYNTYKALGYDAPQISNYQSIDNHYQDSSFYVPGYEHGFGIRKKHQILVGAHKVLWLDYSLVQNLNHKQHILNRLRPDNEIVAIAHPDWEGGYSLKDMAYLTNYDLVEALDQNWRSIPQWDAALSAGRPVFLLADDDAHDISDPYQIQRICTYINSPENKGAQLVRALKSGKSFGAEIFMSNHETFKQKEQLAKSIPILNSVTLKGDTLCVSVTGKPLKITFIGQNGMPRKIVRLANQAWYKFQPDDTYIRTEIVFLKYFKHPAVGPGTVFYLNPVFRYSGEKPSNLLLAEINWPRTFIQRVLGIGSVIGLVVAGFYVRRSRKKEGDR
ncbi:MAG: hypothetical protein PHF97_06185 [Bacteroidales bacterium]|nr:hypothetical protein [Bacteroidales bacterium]MDD4603377.1 hypothetical protein [Bacteroidales bacterium]